MSGVRILYVFSISFILVEKELISLKSLSFKAKVVCSTVEDKNFKIYKYKLPNIGYRKLYGKSAFCSLKIKKFI